MTTFDYARAASTAKRLISRFGGDVTLHVPSGTGDDWNPTVDDTDHTLKAAVTEFKKSEIDGTLVMMTDRKVYLSTEGVTTEPSVEHKMTINGVKHSIVNVMPLQPAGTVVYWKLQVRA